MRGLTLLVLKAIAAGDCAIGPGQIFQQQFLAQVTAFQLHDRVAQASTIEHRGFFADGQPGELLIKIAIARTANSTGWPRATQGAWWV